jgi:CO/xanthine dehydrogenase Mo-binding subunit
VRVTATDTHKVANTSATAASTGSDLNGKAAQDAARQIRERLAACAAVHHGGDAAAVRFANDQVEVNGKRLPFSVIVAQAYVDRVQLWSDGFYATPGLSWNREKLQGQAVLLLRLRRGGQRGAGRHPHRRVEAAARRRAARRRPLAEPGGRHRPDRGRLHPGHGLADDGGAGLAPQDRQC